MLHRIIYVSASRTLLPDAEVAAILAGSRHRNADRDVTGLMLYHDGSFLQVLEGPVGPVQTLYDTIRRDTRHRQIITLWSGAVEERAFPDWRMGFATVTDLPAELRDTVCSLQTLPQSAAADRTVTVLLNRFLANFRYLSKASFTA